MRKLIIPLLLAASLLTITGGLTLSKVSAQLPPTRVFGAVTVDGSPAAIGTVVKAYVGEILCGTNTVTKEGEYFVDVSHITSKDSCGEDDVVVRFTVNDVAVEQTVKFAIGTFVRLDLAASAAPPPAAAPSEPAPSGPPPAEMPPGEMPPGEMPPGEMPPSE